METKEKLRKLDDILIGFGQTSSELIEFGNPAEKLQGVTMLAMLNIIDSILEDGSLDINSRDYKFIFSPGSDIMQNNVKEYLRRREND